MRRFAEFDAQAGAARVQRAEVARVRSLATWAYLWLVPGMCFVRQRSNFIQGWRAAAAAGASLADGDSAGAVGLQGVPPLGSWMMLPDLTTPATPDRAALQRCPVRGQPCRAGPAGSGRGVGAGEPRRAVLLRGDHGRLDEQRRAHRSDVDRERVQRPSRRPARVGRRGPCGDAGDPGADPVGLPVPPGARRLPGRRPGPRAAVDAWRADHPAVEAGPVRHHARRRAHGCLRAR